MKYSNSEHNKAKIFTETEIAKYADYSYRQVAELGLQKRIVIASPPGLEQFNFAMEVNDNDDGGLELSVFYHDLPPYGEVSSWLKEATSIDDISYGESQSRVWFDIYTDDRKEWPSFDMDDGDD